MTNSSTSTMGASIATPKARSEISPLCKRVARGACPLHRDASPKRAPKVGRGIGISPGRTLWRSGGSVHLAGGSVHRLLGAHLAEESGVEVPLDDVGLPGIIS